MNISKSSCWQHQIDFQLIKWLLAMFVTILLSLSFYVRHLQNKQDSTEYGQLRALRHSRSAERPHETVYTFSVEIVPDELKERKTCETSGCIKAAEQIINSLDESHDPCQNFYQFACGNYINHTQIPPGKGIVDTFITLGDLVQNQLDTVISNALRANESKPFRLAIDFNLACRDKWMIEERGLTPLIDILNKLGGWPVVKGATWLSDKFDWAATVKQFRHIGLDTQAIFSLSVETDLKNSSRRVLVIDQTYNIIQREYLVRGSNDAYIKDYYYAMVDSAVKLKANKTRAEKELMEALEFEIKLARISLPREERRNDTALYNPFTIKQLQRSYPYLNWLDYINAFLPDDLSVDENEVVINFVPTFFEQLENILRTTSKRTIANYLLWRAVLITSGTLTDEFRKHQYETAEEPRWKECIQLTSEKFPIPMSILYGRTYSNKGLIKAAEDFVIDIQKAYVDILHAALWMDDQTREAAIKKVKALRTYIGYPDESRVIKKLDEYYKDLEMESDNFLVNSMRLEVFEIDNMFKSLREPVEIFSWDTLLVLNLAELNAYNQFNENSIQFPPTIFQDQFFSADRPNYMNYASIGSIIAHEISHGFDDEGRQYDFNGNLVNWWSPKAETIFLENAQCIIEQYGNYTDIKSNLSVNGIVTQGENLSDNGGMIAAYYGYENWIQQNGPEHPLPGLKYNQQQLFWISFAQSWCAVYNEYYIQEQIYTDEHAPNEYRVNGVVSNMPESTFAHDFSCPTGSNMNPVNKCTVW